MVFTSAVFFAGCLSPWYQASIVPIRCLGIARASKGNPLELPICIARDIQFLFQGLLKERYARLLALGIIQLSSIELHKNISSI